MTPWPEWMRVDTAAAYTGLSAKHLYNLSSAQAITTYHPGAALLFKKADLDAYIEKNKKEAIA